MAIWKQGFIADENLIVNTLETIFLSKARTKHSLTFLFSFLFLFRSSSTLSFHSHVVLIGNVERKVEVEKRSITLTW